MIKIVDNENNDKNVKIIDITHDNEYSGIRIRHNTRFGILNIDGWCNDGGMHYGFSGTVEEFMKLLEGN